METMTGLDAKFLYSETPTAHMHTVKVLVSNTSVIDAGISYDALLQVLERQLRRLPPLRRRAVPVPFGLGHPVWVEDPEFNLHHHVTRSALSEPGGDRELAAAVAEFSGTPLARDRPLWELLLLDGLAGGRMAFVAKLHHAVADGTAAVALLQSVVRANSFDASADDDPDLWRPESIPDRRQLLKMAAHDHVPRWKGFPRLAVQSARGARASEARRRSFAVKPPLPLHHIPNTSFNVSLTPERTFAMTNLPLTDLKAIRRATGTTLNDVYLAVCAGALRRYLGDRGELPERPLVASVPVSTDPNVARMSGNRVDNLYVSIGTDIADPRAPQAHLRRDKRSQRGAGTARTRPHGTTRRCGPAPNLPFRPSALVPLTCGEPPPSAPQRGAVQCRGSTRSDFLRADRTRVPLLCGSHPRRDRAQHHRLEL